MNRWTGKVAIVTGASVGIGAAVCVDLVKQGLLVIGLARRVEKVEELAKSLPDESGRLYAVKCDVTIEDELISVFKWVTEDIGPVHILINNAGLTRPTNLTDGDSALWREVLNTNVMGLCICAREAFKIMKEHNIDGHIVNINSIAGHFALRMLKPNLNIYPASKFAVTALTESLRTEMFYYGSKTKVTSISPGYVKTEFATGFPDDGTRDVLDQIPFLTSEDISSAILYVLGTPPHVQIHEMIIRPIGDQC